MKTSSGLIVEADIEVKFSALGLKHIELDPPTLFSMPSSSIKRGRLCTFQAACYA